MASFVKEIVDFDTRYYSLSLATNGLKGPCWLLVINLCFLKLKYK